ncbi:hypothetical protein SISSUDRAFT_30803 [Sistotremastrum suecicum HHB10207 ss-3]|uniref:MIT domain-containing protein n=1 Tax=Sistotremastrum suecicum HHB10207 ss-3 TaxID=1314776 RepID=A0A166JBT1_9AGAM|nr:hypothetical protein SISSUDRAFT_30803 [Sistotremastrum suecicum HHB10207 ss-3]
MESLEYEPRQMMASQYQAPKSSFFSSRYSRRSSAMVPLPGPPPEAPIPMIPSSRLSSFPNQATSSRTPISFRIDSSPPNESSLDPSNESLTTLGEASTASNIHADRLRHDSLRHSDRPLMTLPASTPESIRPSSRRALTEALRLAQEAVYLDAQNNDPQAAFDAYAKSVDLLNEVIERVVSSDRDPDHRRRPGRRRSDSAKEDEVRRLKSIHETYAERMRILTEMYDIHRPGDHLVSQGGEPSPGMTPTPMGSMRYDLERPPEIGRAGREDTTSLHADSNGTMPDTPTLTDTSYDGSESIHSVVVTHSNPTSPSASVEDLVSREPSPSPPRALGRLSTLPPARPVPQGLPPARPISNNPSSLLEPPLSDRASRSSESLLSGHNRSGSVSPLGALEEEQETGSLEGHVSETIHDSHPLPPLPVPSPNTPRVDPAPIRSVSPPNNTPRPRGDSATSSQSEPIYRTINVQKGSFTSGQLVNPTTMEGTIFQRRSKYQTASTLPSTVPVTQVTKSVNTSSSTSPTLAAPAPVHSMGATDRFRSREEGHPLPPTFLPQQAAALLRPPLCRLPPIHSFLPLASSPTLPLPYQATPMVSA